MVWLIEGGAEPRCWLLTGVENSLSDLTAAQSPSPLRSSSWSSRRHNARRGTRWLDPWPCRRRPRWRPSRPHRRRYPGWCPRRRNWRWGRPWLSLGRRIGGERTPGSKSPDSYLLALPPGPYLLAPGSWLLSPDACLLTSVSWLLTIDSCLRPPDCLLAPVSYPWLLTFVSWISWLLSPSLSCLLLGQGTASRQCDNYGMK